VRLISTKPVSGGTIPDVEDPRGAMPPAVTADDPAMVAGCRAGEASSLEQFFVTHVRYVERVIARLTGPTPDLEDLVQTTFIQAFQSFGRYRGEASLKTWVTRIAVHVSLNQLRAGVRRRVSLQLVPDLALPGDPARAADAELSTQQLARRLYELLDRLSPKKRVAFLLYTVEEYSLEEVAALTGASRSAAKSRIWFARRELLAAARNQADLRAFIQTRPGAEPWR
jgi:RNA polymerase sigma-70 factor (ECF subfamily)